MIRLNKIYEFEMPYKTTGCPWKFYYINLKARQTITYDCDESEFLDMESGRANKDILMFFRRYIGVRCFSIKHMW